MFAWLQVILTCLTLLAATLAWAACKRVSGSLRLAKRMNDLEVTTADLQSSFESLMESHKRLRSRTGMRELREREAPETKEQARMRIFGTKSGPDFARAQLERK